MSAIRPWKDSRSSLVTLSEKIAAMRARSSRVGVFTAIGVPPLLQGGIPAVLRHFFQGCLGLFTPFIRAVAREPGSRGARPECTVSGQSDRQLRLALESGRLGLRP